MNDLKIKKVRFVVPADVAGLGMVDRLNLGIDSETKQPISPGVSATFVVESHAIRVVTSSGETWVPFSNVASLQPLFEDRLEASKAAKAAPKSTK